MKKILLATDLTVNSDRAMERALKLAVGTRAKLHIINVMPAYKAKGFGTTFKKDTEDLIKGYIFDYKDSEHIDITITAIQSREPFAEILGYAQKIKADLIVMGMHGKAKFPDLFVGTTIERVARKGAQPILMVKNKPTGPYQSILAGVDFAPASRAALRMAMEIAPQGVFSAVHTYQVAVAYPTMANYAIEAYAHTEETNKKAMDAFLKTEISHFKKEHNGKTKRLSGKMVEGAAYETLVKEARKAKADLIAIGAHGGPVLTPSKLGGAAEYILAHPPCDVLVVRE